MPPVTATQMDLLRTKYVWWKSDSLSEFLKYFFTFDKREFFIFLVRGGGGPGSTTSVNSPGKVEFKLSIVFVVFKCCWSAVDVCRRSLGGWQWDSRGRGHGALLGLPCQLQAPPARLVADTLHLQRRRALLRWDSSQERHRHHTPAARCEYSINEAPYFLTCY